MYRVNLHSRIATRIMSRVGQGSYATEEDIYKATFKLHWPSWFKVNQTIRVKVTGVKCPLKSLDFVTLRIKDAVCDRFREEGALRPSVSVRDPDVRIHAYLTQDQYQLYLDTSGAPLYQRGFRDVSVIAPLRENLAAGIIMLSGWIPGTPLRRQTTGPGADRRVAAASCRSPRRSRPGRGGGGNRSRPRAGGYRSGTAAPGS